MKMQLELKGKFKTFQHYSASLKSGYTLLPFQFIKLDNQRKVAVNLVGQHAVLNGDQISSLVNGTLSSESGLYNDLKSKHFLCDNDSKIWLDLLAMKYRTIMDPVASFTGLHMFVVTLRCDHSCPYCQVSRQSTDKTKFDMSEEVASKAIDFMFRSPSPNIKVEFQGGEPLLNFDLIKYVVREAKERNKTHQRDLQFVIATNLALVTQEILDYCLAEDIYLSTSLDGPEDLHNSNRPRPGKDSHKKAIEGISRARQTLGPDKISALMTTTKASLPRARDIIDEYIRQGFSSIFLRPLSPYGFAVKTKSYSSYGADEWLRFYTEGLDYIIELNRNGYPFAEQYASIILQKILSPIGGTYVDLQAPSGIGISGLVFNYDGDVYASDESRMLAEMGDKTFRMGSLHTDSYRDVMTSDALLDALEFSLPHSAPMCSDCAFLPYCGADPVYHHALQGNFMGHKAFSSFCGRNMGLFRHLILAMEDRPGVKELFRSWVRV